MKVCLFAGDIRLNRKDEKSMKKYKLIDFLENKTVKMFSSPFVL